MGKLTMALYISNMHKRYKLGNRAEKARILDEYCATSGCHRKSAIRALNKKSCRRKRRAKQPGRKQLYKPEMLLPSLKTIWFASDQVCGKRLKALLPAWLPFYEKHYGQLSVDCRQQLENISSATIDRLLKASKSGQSKGLSGTKPGSLLKTQIPICTDQWDNTVPGFIEADTVAHCGESLSGDFIWSLTMVDIATGWTENRATWNKGAQGVLTAIESVKEALPFKIKGFDSDNGSEFLNHHLVAYLAEKKIQFTRSRPYKKNDNAHVEQKNWTHVRQLMGYERFSDPRLVAMMNDLYANEIADYRNYFLPCFKLISKERIKSKMIKKHDKPITPFARLLLSEHIDEATKKHLSEKYHCLDPFTLKDKIEKKLQAIYLHVDVKNRQKRKAV
jgi:hypothetical protein